MTMSEVEIDGTGELRFHALTGPQKLSRRRCKTFLKVLERNGGNVKAATEAAGWRTSVPVYTLRKENKEFAAAWDAALVSAGDVVEEEALRRGIQGVMEPVYHKGIVVGHKLVYSDRILELLLKGAKPDKYRERVEVGGTIKHLAVAVIPAVAPTAEAWELQSIPVHQSQDANRITVEGTAEVVSIEPIKESAGELQRR